MPLRTSPRKRTVAAAVVKAEETVRTATTKAQKATRTKAAPVEAAAPARKRKRVAGPKAKDEDEEHKCDSHDEGEEPQEVKTKAAPKKRKTQKEKEDDAVPLAERTAVGSLKKAMYIGAHVSAAGGVQNSISNAVHVGGNAFALFLKSQRKWSSPPLDPVARDAFHTAAKENAYAAGQHVLPHGSYLVNLAQADAEKATQAYDNFVDDLKRCDALGIKLYNFHPGSTGGASMASATARIAAQLNKSHKATKTVITVLENMCGHGNIIGGKFEDLRDIIAGVEDKERVGVCIDTCHGFAAGYDLRSPEAFQATMAEFDRIVGLKYLKALHMNDSKAPFGSHRDLHANIGTGFLGLRAFHNIMTFDGFQNMPLVLETPIEKKGADGKTVEDKKVWADEIKLLEWLIDADPESDEFKQKEKDLWASGEAERKRVQQQVDAKAAKDAKKGGKKGKKAAASTDDENDE
ncbi:xylose isomerase-like protein [Coniella lustricola]|uniref:Apurinic-apyrimidinic endonuclease 1 n=1 Tax=Coniella lustricola TaxID=2025994 RepID=A0A2T3A0V7_9PEZI|nr:xylose isomerase-like protein [Coniella lustricola]